MFGQIMCRPLDMIAIWMHLQFIFHVLATGLVLSSNHQPDRSNCGLNLKVDSGASEQISVSRHPPAAHRILLSRGGRQKHAKYCDVFITTTATDHLIELEWSHDSSHYLPGHLQMRSNSNQSVLVISWSRNAHRQLAESSMQMTGNLIGGQRFVVVRVQRALMPHLDDNLLIKVNSLKLIRLDFRELASRPTGEPYCSNIYKSLIDLDSDASMTNELTGGSLGANRVNHLNDEMLVDYQLNLSSPSSANQNCVKIKVKTFHSSRLIAKRELDTCALSGGIAEPIAVIRSASIQVKAVNASVEASVCLSLINVHQLSGSVQVSARTDDHERSFLTRKKSKLKRHLRPIEMFAFNVREEDNDQIDNCFDLKDAPEGQSNDSIRCYVLFENMKLQSEGADQFCKKVLLPYEYAEVGLANLSSAQDLDFAKQFIHRKLFHNSIRDAVVPGANQPHGNAYHPNSPYYWTVFNGHRKNDRNLSSFNNFTFWVKANHFGGPLANESNPDSANSANSCMQMKLIGLHPDAKRFNGAHSFEPRDCAQASPFLCQFTYRPDTASSSFGSAISCGEQHHFGGKVDSSSPDRWHVFGLSKSISQSSQKLNCTFRFSAVKRSAGEAAPDAGHHKVNEETNKDGEVELLFSLFHLKTSAFINSCKYDYIEFSVKNPRHSADERNKVTDRRRLCGNWNEKIKLLRFIGEEITLTLISNTNNIIRDFEARVRRIEPDNHQDRPKEHIDHSSLIPYKNPQDSQNQLCSTSGNFIFHSNWCYLLNYYPQVSYRTSLAVCAEHHSELLTIANQMTDFYGQIDLIRMLLSLLPDGQKISHGDFWVRPPEEPTAPRLAEPTAIKVEQMNGEKAKRAESGGDWFSKINDNSLAESKSSDCLELVLDEYHYLTENHLKMKSPNLEVPSGKNLSVFAQLIDAGLIRRVQCDQRAAFVCRRRPCEIGANATSQTADCNYPAKPDELHQVFTEPDELSVTSSNFPNNYPNLLHQSVFVNVTDLQSVYIIQFLYLDVETQKECLYDYVSLDFYDSNRHVNNLRICGRFNSDQHRPHRVHSSLNSHPHRHNHQPNIAQINHLTNFSYVTKPGQSIKLEFRTDYSIRRKGFKAKIRRVQLDWCLHNSSVIQLTSSQPNRTLHTPGYPELTLPNLNCRLTINAESPDHRILFNLLDIKINQNESHVQSQPATNKHCLNNENFLELQLSNDKAVPICYDYTQQLDDVLLKQISAKSFVSFGPSMVITYRTFRRVFGERYNIELQGVQFSVSSVRRNESLQLTVPLLYEGDHNETISNRSITLYSVGKIQFINYPYSLPDALSATIFIKASLAHNIELRASKEHFFNNNNDHRSIFLANTNHCKLIVDNRTDFKPQIKIRDNFAHLQYNPAKPEQWNLCLDESSADHPIKPTKLIKSNLHLLSIKLSHSWRPSSFYFRVIKDESLKNKTYTLPLIYPVDSCLYRPCENGGQCVRHEINRGEGEKVNGSNQTDPVDIKSSMNPIQPETFRCECATGWYGMFCHLRICDLKPCSPNGQCTQNVDDYSNYTCHCFIGYSGKHCTDPIATCDRGSNPCNDRGHCFLIEGIPTCRCNKFYDGKYCEKYKIRVKYRPLSERMVDEPFWLGLAAILVVLFFITLVYLLKKKFSDRIERFFAQEIERSKTQSAFGVERTGNRYSLTSNMALNLNNAPGGGINPNQCMMRSHSSIICKLNNCRHSKWRITGGHSDTECRGYSSKELLSAKAQKKENGYFSDTEFTNRKRFPALLFFSQKIVNSTSSAPNEATNVLRKNSSFNRSFEKPRRYSLYDFVVRRQSNNLFGFDLEKIRKKSSKKHAKKQGMLMTSHASKSSSIENDHYLRIPSMNIETVPNEKLVYELDEYNHSDNLSQEDANRLMHTSSSLLNYQVITENSEENEPDTSMQVAELSNLENVDLRTSFSSDNQSCENLNLDSKFDTNLSIGFDTKFQPTFQSKIQASECLRGSSKSISPVLRTPWSRSRSEQQHYNYFYSPPPSMRHPSDRYFEFDTSPRASARRKKFASYKQYSCLNLGAVGDPEQPPVDFINDENLRFNKQSNMLFVNTNFPLRRLSAPSGQEASITAVQSSSQQFTGRQQLSQPLASSQQLAIRLSQQQIHHQQQQLSQQNISKSPSPRSHKSGNGKHGRWNKSNTVDDACNVPSIMINDRQMNLPQIESLSSEQIYGTPDPASYYYLNLPSSKSSSSKQSKQSSPKSASRLSSKDFGDSQRSRIQKSYSAGNNYRYDSLVDPVDKHQQQMAMLKMRSAQDFNLAHHHQSSRAKSPRRLRAEIKQTPSWPASISTLSVPTTSKQQQQPVNYSSTSSSSSSSSSENEDNTQIEREPTKANTRRRFSPHLILSNTHKLACQQSLPTPPSTAPAGYETAWTNSSNFALNSAGGPGSSCSRKKPRSPTTLYQSNNRKSANLYPNINYQATGYQAVTCSSTKKPSTRCYSADNRETARDLLIRDGSPAGIYQIPTSSLLSTGEASSKFTGRYQASTAQQQHPPLYRARSFNTAAPVQFPSLTRQQKSSSSPTTSSPSLSDVNSEIRWRNAIESSSANFFGKNSRTADKPLTIYKPSQLRAAGVKSSNRTVRRSNSDEKAATVRRAYYCSGQQATRRKSKSFERSPTDEEIAFVPLQNPQQRNKLKNQSSSDTVLLEPIQQQLSLDQQQASFSSESIQKKENEPTPSASRHCDRNNNPEGPLYDSSCIYFEIANEAKSITNDEVKSLARKLTEDM